MDRGYSQVGVERSPSPEPPQYSNRQSTPVYASSGNDDLGQSNPQVYGKIGDPASGYGAASYAGQSAQAAYNPQSHAGNIQDAERGRSYRIWQVEYYSKYFDVDTSDVMARLRLSLFPNSSFSALLATKTDLYGPFWVPTTLIFAIFTTSSIDYSIAAYTAGTSLSYDFTKLSIALSLVYCYAFAVPALIWGAAKFYRRSASLIDLLSVYGYGSFIWIPVTLLCIIPSEIARWSIVGVTAALSGSFIVRNVHALLSAITPNATTVMPGPTLKMITLLLAAAHIAFALALKIIFFGWSFTTTTST